MFSSRDKATEYSAITYGPLCSRPLFENTMGNRISNARRNVSTRDFRDLTTRNRNLVSSDIRILCKTLEYNGEHNSLVARK